MKLILPMAGVGQRLRPFTFYKPKAALKIAGKMVLDHILSRISYNLPKKTPLAVIYGYKKEQIETYLNQSFSDEFQISYIVQPPKGYDGDFPYFGGLGEAILLTQQWWESESKDIPLIGHTKNETLIFLCDMIPLSTKNDPGYDFILAALKNEAIDGVIGTMDVKKEETMYYGIVETDEQGKITRLVEKPKKTHSTQAIAGVYAFKEKAMKRLYSILNELYEEHRKDEHYEEKEFQFTPALDMLIQEGFHLIPKSFGKRILDFGRPENLLKGNQILLENARNLSYGAVKLIQNSFIDSYVYIGEKCKINRSIIGPYVSMGNNCVIEDCNLKDVVLGDNVVLKNVICDHSIIGDNVKIDSVIRKNMILGDHSYITKEEAKSSKSLN